MTPEEHQLISGLFDRMRAQGPVDKDREAESLIMNSIMTTPDAAYKLVQSVLVMEGAIEDAQSRIQQMEQRIQQLETGAQARPASGGGFLGGLFGGSKQQTPPPRPTSVPMTGARPMGYGQPQQAGTPWGNQGGYQGQPAGYQQQPAPAQGGGFMKSAMATAAGVAGGVLVANAIGNMFGGSQAHAAGGQNPAGDSPYAVGSKGGDNTEHQDSASNDPGTYEQEQQGAEQQDEGGGGWFGGGGGSDDSEY